MLQFSVGLLAFAAASATTLPTSAFSADASSPVFSGFRFGLGGGIVDARHHWGFFNNTIAETFDHDRAVLRISAHAGYDVRLGDHLFGVELEGGLPQAAWRETEATNYANRLRRSRLGADWSVSARVGHVFGNVMVYAKAGFTEGEIAYQSRVRSTGLITTESADRYGGFLVGAGVERALGEGLSAGLEYRFSRYFVGHHDQKLNGYAGPQFVYGARTDVHGVSLRIDYRI